jgi:hypothetical protein
MANNGVDQSIVDILSMPQLLALSFVQVHAHIREFKGELRAQV